MRKLLYIVILLLNIPLVMNGQVFPNFGSERAGLSTLSFLKNDGSPRSLGMGGTSIANDGDAYGVFVNPASLTDIDKFSLQASNMLVGAGINQSFLSAIIANKNRGSALGISLNSLNSGEMEVRTEFQPFGTGEKFYVTYLSAGLTYSKSFSKYFSFGLTMKYLYEGLAGYTNHTVAADFGFLYNTDFNDLKFAVVVQNFGGNSTLSGDVLQVKLNRTSNPDLNNSNVPTIFKLGFSIVPYHQDKHRIRTGFQLNHPNDNAENYRLGAEYDYIDLLFVRAGYRFNLKGMRFPTFGFGLRGRVGAHPLMFDYAVNPTNFMGTQHLLGVSLYLNKDQRQNE